MILRSILAFTFSALIFLAMFNDIDAEGCLGLNCQYATAYSSQNAVYVPQATGAITNHVTMTLSLTDWVLIDHEMEGFYGDEVVAIPRDALVVKVVHTGGSYEVRLGEWFYAIAFRDIEGYARFAFFTKSACAREAHTLTFITNASLDGSVYWKVILVYPSSYIPQSIHPLYQSQEPGRIMWVITDAESVDFEVWFLPPASLKLSKIYFPSLYFYEERRD